MNAGSGVAPATHHDQDDVDDAIAAWSDDDFMRLSARAASAAVGTDLSPEDVLNEAAVLLLSGKRPWRRGVPFEAHVTMVMKQIGSNRLRAMLAKPTKELEVFDNSPDAYRGPGIDDVVGSRLRVQNLEKNLFKLFDDDPIGWAIFEGRLVEQMSVEEACDLAGIPRTDYETALKRVTRKLAKAVGSGDLR